MIQMIEIIGYAVILLILSTISVVLIVDNINLTRRLRILELKAEIMLEKLKFKEEINK